MNDTDSMDHYLGRVLKNWVGCLRAPGEARERLLWTASRASEPSPHIKRKRRNVFNSRYQPIDWSHTLCTWSIMYSFHNGITASRLLI